jgi:hypothetical protein
MMVLCHWQGLTATGKWVEKLFGRRLQPLTTWIYVVSADFHVSSEEFVCWEEAADAVAERGEKGKEGEEEGGRGWYLEEAADVVVDRPAPEDRLDDRREVVVHDDDVWRLLYTYRDILLESLHIAYARWIRMDQEWHMRRQPSAWATASLSKARPTWYRYVRP